MDSKNLNEKKASALQAIVEKAEKLVLWQRVAILEFEVRQPHEEEQARS